jgi:DNA-binding transcriptional ArsR family regulator
MESDAIVKRLEGLESELSALNDTLLTIRYDDYRRTVVAEINEVLAEYNEQLMEPKIGLMDNFMACSRREYCKNSITRVIEEANIAYLKFGTHEAIEVLEALRSHMASENGCHEDCGLYVRRVLEDTATIYQLSDKIRDRLERVALEKVSSGRVPMDMDPEDVSNLISPLSNSHRLAILSKLYDGEMAFSDLSSSTGLKTGHLQFHIKALMEQGYLRKAKKRGSYCISLRGLIAIDALKDLDRKLKDIGTVDEGEDK